MRKINEKPLYIDALAWYPESIEPWAEENLVKESKYGETVRLYVKVAGKIGIPLNAAGVKATDDRRELGSAINVNLRLPPRNETQKSLIDVSTEYLLNGQNHILQAATGTGKTFMAINIAVNLNTTTLIIVTKEDLMNQWKNEILRFTDVKEHEIGIARQNKCDYKGKKFVIGMMHSLAKDKYPNEFKRYFGFVVWDECHRANATTFAKTCSLFPAKYKCGLSATASRQDKKEFIFHYHIGPVAQQADQVMMKMKALVRRTRFKIPRVVRRGDFGFETIPLPHSAARMMGLYKAMAADHQRNALILDFAQSAYKKGRNIIVFSDLKDAHLSPLFHQMVARGVPKTDMAYYVGGMSEKERAISKNRRILFATYSMASEATDIPRLDTAILCTPRASVKQIVGRILREYPDKKQPIVFDLVDSGSSILAGFAGARRRTYIELGGEVVNI